MVPMAHALGETAQPSCHPVNSTVLSPKLWQAGNHPPWEAFPDEKDAICTAASLKGLFSIKNGSLLGVIPLHTFIMKISKPAAKWRGLYSECPCTWLPAALSPPAPHLYPSVQFPKCISK